MQLKQIRTFNEKVNGFNSRYPKGSWDIELKDKLQKDFTYHSNKLEGTDIGFGATMKHLQGDFVSNSPMKDLADLTNHHEIIQTVFDNYENWTITVEKVKEVHGKLMKDDVQWIEEELADLLL